MMCGAHHLKTSTLQLLFYLVETDVDAGNVILVLLKQINIYVSTFYL